MVVTYILVVYSLLLVLCSNCGYSKCDPQLRVISHPSSPIQVILKGDGGLPPHQPTPHYQTHNWGYNQYHQKLGFHTPYLSYGGSQGEHNVELQIPFEVNLDLRYQGLKAAPDRLVLPAQTRTCKDSKHFADGLDTHSVLDDAILHEMAKAKNFRYDYYVIPRNALQNRVHKKEILHEILKTIKPVASLRTKMPPVLPSNEEKYSVVQEDNVNTFSIAKRDALWFILNTSNTSRNGTCSSCSIESMEDSESQEFDDYEEQWLSSKDNSASQENDIYFDYSGEERSLEKENIQRDGSHILNTLFGGPKKESFIPWNDILFSQRRKKEANNTKENFKGFSWNIKHYFGGILGKEQRKINPNYFFFQQQNIGNSKPSPFYRFDHREAITPNKPILTRYLLQQKETNTNKPISLNKYFHSQMNSNNNFFRHKPLRRSNPSSKWSYPSKAVYNDLEYPPNIKFQYIPRSSASKKYAEKCFFNVPLTHPHKIFSHGSTSDYTNRRRLNKLQEQQKRSWAFYTNPRRVARDVSSIPRKPNPPAKLKPMMVVDVPLEFPWQQEYQKVAKKPGNLHPMLKPKSLIKNKSSTPDEGKQLTKAEDKSNQIPKGIEKIKRLNNTTKVSRIGKLIQLSTTTETSITTSVTPSTKLKELIAQARENLRQKLEERRNLIKATLSKQKSSTDSPLKRRKRSTIIEADTPFFRVARRPSADDDSAEQKKLILQKKKKEEEHLSKSLMKPFNAEHIVPHDPIFYLLNLPLRFLDHINKLKDRITPVLHAIPLMMQKSRKYAKEMTKSARNNLVDFGSKIIGSFTRLSPSKDPWDSDKPKKRRYRRSLEQKPPKDVTANQSAEINEDEEEFLEKILKNAFLKIELNFDEPLPSLSKGPRYKNEYELVHETYDPLDQRSNQETFANLGSSSTLWDSADHEGIQKEPLKEDVAINESRINEDKVKVSESKVGKALLFVVPKLEPSRNKQQPLIDVYSKNGPSYENEYELIFKAYDPYLQDEDQQDNQESNGTDSFTHLTSSNSLWNSSTSKKQNCNGRVEEIPLNENTTNVTNEQEICKDKTKLLEKMLREKLSNVHDSIENNINNHLPLKEEIDQKVLHKGPKYETEYELVHKSYDPYSQEYIQDSEEASSSSKEYSEEQKSRKKRALFKLVDESEVENFLKEKFLSLGGSSNGNSYGSSKISTGVSENVLRLPRARGETTHPQVVLERVVPRIIIDDNGFPFIEIDGLKKPLFNSVRKPNLKSPFLGSSLKQPVMKYNPLTTFKKDDTLANILEKAKRYTTDTDQMLLAYSSDSNMHIQTTREKLNQILEYIQKLLHWNFEEDVHIYEDFLELQNRKTAIVRNWKLLLMQEKHNNIGEKTLLLKSFKKVQELKDSLMQHIVKKLQTGQTFNSKNLIRSLVKLQKLQCVIVKIAEEFSDGIHIGKFDVEKEIKFVDYLHNIDFLPYKNHEEIRSKLHAERDKELKKQITLLEDLKEILTVCQADNKFNDLIFEEAKLLWEMKNIEKLQKESLMELNSKMRSGLKIRKELKILFDLQKQYNYCEEKHEKLVEDILKDLGKTSRRNSVVLDEEKETVRAPKANLLRALPKTKRIKKKPASASKLRLRPSTEENRIPLRVTSNGNLLEGYKLIKNV